MKKIKYIIKFNDSYEVEMASKSQAIEFGQILKGKYNIKLIQRNELYKNDIVNFEGNILVESWDLDYSFLLNKS